MTALIWNGNWAWALPLIFRHRGAARNGAGLHQHARRSGASGVCRHRRNFLTLFVIVMGMVTMLATVLHALEAGIWAVGLPTSSGALPNGREAMLYSLSAITTYGHAELLPGTALAADGCA